MRIEEGATEAADTAARDVQTTDDLRVNQNNTFTPLIVVTATSVRYGVTFTWAMRRQTWIEDGGPPAIALKTGQVNAICGHEHVQDFWTEQDTGPSKQLYNFAVIAVGTDDGAAVELVRWRMDQIGLPGVFGAIDAAWARIVAAGAS